MTFSWQQQLNQLAAAIRQHEAHKARGKPDLLDQLQATSDQYLLLKWSWLFTICGIIISFAILPVLASFIHIFRSELLSQLVWILTKICMGISLLILFLAIALSLSKQNNGN